LANQAYGDWEVMMCEALVRAAEIKYLKNKSFEQGIIEEKINREKGDGFFGLKTLLLNWKVTISKERGIRHWKVTCRG
jgi:hypothetical protein